MWSRGTSGDGDRCKGSVSSKRPAVAADAAEEAVEDVVVVVAVEATVATMVATDSVARIPLVVALSVSPISSMRTTSTRPLRCVDFPTL